MIPSLKSPVCVSAWSLALSLLVPGAVAMEVQALSDQLILSGPVVEGDQARIEKALRTNPGITTVILRNSPGGHPWTGFRIGELIRQKGLTTAVSGYCYSSCSRMYLGGVKRMFTDDFPAGITAIGFHGHYKKDGTLDTELMEKTGLRDWIVKFLGDKADIPLIDRWVNIPSNRGLLYTFNPDRVRRGGVSTYFCAGTEAAGAVPFKCEPIAKTALDLGVATTTEVIASHDQIELGALVPPIPAPSGHAEIGDVTKLPVQTPAALAGYKQYLEHGGHKAFAVALNSAHFAAAAEGIGTAAEALRRCSLIAMGPCQLYAVDDEVVWPAP